MTPQIEQLLTYFMSGVLIILWIMIFLKIGEFINIIKEYLDWKRNNENK